MQELYHYTSHSWLKAIKDSQELLHTLGFQNLEGVWLTRLRPQDHSKEQILYNNYKYDPSEARRKLSRAACYVKILLPLDLVEDVSHPSNDPDQDVWIWKDNPLPLSWHHDFGVIEGTEDLFLKDKVMATMERAFRASSIQRKLGIEESVHGMLVLAMEADYERFDSQDPFGDIEDRGLTICSVFVDE